MKESNLWECQKGDCIYYSAPISVKKGREMDALRSLFPDAIADPLNFVLFSTSGVHGSHRTIEEDYADYKQGKSSLGITFLVVHPRLVVLRYGNVFPKTEDDYSFLKQLRQTSKEAIESVLFSSTAPSAN